MKPEQIKVAVGALLGVATMVFAVGALSMVIPPPDIATLAERITFALRVNILAVLPLFVMIVSVGNSRFLSSAINPLNHKETSGQEIDGRVADNTLQQNFIFLVGTLGLSTVLSTEWLQALVALAVVFVCARIAFWVGYRIHPLYRAFGMAATGYMNLGILFYTLYAMGTAM
jgi:hypothetical protein